MKTNKGQVEKHVVRGDNEKKLQKKVDLMIQSGWTTVGGVKKDPDSRDGLGVVQIMQIVIDENTPPWWREVKRF